MKLVEAFLTKNPCYKAGKTITVKGLMLHSVGCPQPKASVFINSWNSASYDRACVHGFIDGNDGTAYQTLPWNRRGWHCASGSKGSGNNTHIGVEMCEPACIKYTSGSNFTCSDIATARAVAKRTYDTAVELFAMLCNKYGLDPLADGVVISHREGHARGIASNHGDPEHLWNGLGMSYTMNGFRKAVKAAMNSSTASTTSGLQASSLKSLTEAEVVAKVGPLFTQNQKDCGILASVSAAQFILESGYGKTDLAQNANNVFGMKCSLSGNTWSGSTWDGTSKYTKVTKEDDGNGNLYDVTADFRKYANVEQSIADHAAYLLGAKKGSNLRYAGLKGETDYRTAITIIKNGGYATDTSYIDKICNIIERWNLTQYDYAGGDVLPDTAQPWYRVRKSWADASSQKGAFHDLTNAKNCADQNPGYSVYDEAGNALYPAAAFQPYMVRVKISDLNIRTQPTVDSASHGFTGVGSFTIVDEAVGKVNRSTGATAKWGLLKSYADNRNGWICLNYATKI